MIHRLYDTKSYNNYLQSHFSREHLFDTLSHEANGLELHEAQLGFVADSGEELTGIFTFDIYEEDRLLEKHKWLSDSEAACREMLDYLKEQYPSYQAEFTFSPQNELLKALLKEFGADIFPEQQNMKLHALPALCDTDGIELLSEPYREQYYALHHHGDDNYWTGEMIVAEPETFHVLVALEGDCVVGYLDFTHCEEINNIADLYVSEQSRRKGYGAKLMAKALEMNAPKGMTLQVDVDNSPARRLYERMGFQRVEGENFIDARWSI